LRISGDLDRERVQGRFFLLGAATLLQEGGAAGACACAALTISAQTSAEAREMNGRTVRVPWNILLFPVFCLRGGAAMQPAGRSGIIATLDPGANRI